MPNKPALRLLPNYFKKIGLGLVALTVLTFIVLVMVRLELSQGTKDLVKHVLLSMLILALTLIAVARDKREDERTLTIRLQAMAFAFVYAVGYPLVSPWISMLLGGGWEMVGGDSLVFNMLLIYHVVFSISNYAR